LVRIDIVGSGFISKIYTRYVIEFILNSQEFEVKNVQCPF